MDHIWPRHWTLRGTIILPQTGQSRDHWTNLAPACSDCNHKRGDLSLVAYLIRRPLR